LVDKNTIKVKTDNIFFINKLAIKRIAKLQIFKAMTKNFF